jgi:flagellar basal-body rod modification protein FlgD
LQGITQLNESAKTLNQAVACNMGTRASGMLGQRALVPSDMAVLESDGGLRGAVSVPPGAKGPIQVQILDDSGHEVSHLTVQAENGSGNQETMVPFSWDGKGPRGRAMTPGTYHIAATANGQALTTYGSARVQSVALGSSDAQTMVDLGALGQMPISDIRQLTL